MSLMYAPHVPFWKGQVCQNSQLETKTINQTWGRNAPTQIIKILFFPKSFFSKIRNSTPKFEKKSRFCIGHDGKFDIASELHSRHTPVASVELPSLILPQIDPVRTFSHSH